MRGARLVVVIRTLIELVGTVNRTLEVIRAVLSRTLLVRLLRRVTLRVSVVRLPVDRRVIAYVLL